MFINIIKSIRKRYIVEQQKKSQIRLENIGMLLQPERKLEQDPEKFMINHIRSGISTYQRIEADAEYRQ